MKMGRCPDGEAELLDMAERDDPKFEEAGISKKLGCVVRCGADWTQGRTEAASPEETSVRGCKGSLVQGTDERKSGVTK
jgi:hypothetical protein